MTFIGRCPSRFPALLLLCALAIRLPAGTLLDTNGTALLRLATTNLDGTGLRVIVAEASSNTNLPDFQLDPSDGNIAQPGSRFTYVSALGTATNYPNAVGAYSGHATQVGSHCFGRAFGVATNIAQVDNYDAQYFIDTYIFATNPPAPDARIVNQSFTFGPLSVPAQQSVDADYDNVAATHNTLFISGAGNGGPVSAPATAYNGIGVGCYYGPSSTGPTPDNGRCKPDLTAPAAFTSFSTPQVAGAAAVLLQAALRGDGGPDTNAAADSRTLKALLLNGAVKPANWTNAPAAPLDLRHGAGLLNVFNAYQQLAGDQHAALEQTSVPLLDPHPPGGNPNSLAALSGWDLAALTSTPPNRDRLNHYYFTLTNPPAGAWMFTATLAWNRQAGESAINDLDLFLYDTATSNVIAQSLSGVDNVEHLHVTNLPPGRYDVQVLKYGGNAGNGNVTPGETYALAWEFTVPGLRLAGGNPGPALTWPAYPDGFGLESTTNLAIPAAWTAWPATPAFTNGLRQVPLDATNAAQFFRLKRPAF